MATARRSGAPAKKAATKNTQRAGGKVSPRSHKPAKAGSIPAPATNPSGPSGKVPQRPSKAPEAGSIPAGRSKKPTAAAKPAPAAKTGKRKAPAAAAPSVADMLKASPAPDVDAGFTPSVLAFVNEYLRDLNGTAAYLRVHPTAKANTAATESWRILRNPEIRKLIEQRREKLALEVDFSNADWLREQIAIALADAGELTQMRHVSCNHCWPETEEPLPMWMEPNPDCTHCSGEGVPRPYFADTRKLSPAARRLFSAVQVTKDGVRIHLRDQDAALERLGRALGVFEKDNRQKAATLGEALREFLGALHSTGSGRIQVAPRGDKEEGGHA